MNARHPRTRGRLLLGLATCIAALQSASPTVATTAWRNERGNLIDTSACDSKGGVDYIRTQVLLGLTRGLLSSPVEDESVSLDRISDAPLRHALLRLGATGIRPVFPDFPAPVEGSSLTVVDLSRFFAVDFERDLDVPAVCEELARYPAVLFAEPNYIVPFLSEATGVASRARRLTFPDEPSDLDWASQWNLQDDIPGIGCPTAWGITTGDPSIRLGNVEKRIYEDHYDLNVTDGRRYYRDVFTGQPTAGPLTGPYSSHATHSAGIMCALTNNERGVAGVAGGSGSSPGCSLVCVQVENPPDMGLLAFATAHAADPRRLNCDVLSFSLNFPCYSETLRGAVAHCFSVGSSVVAAKGNDGLSTFGIPADLDYGWVLAVGAYGPNGLYCDEAEGNCEFTSNYGLGIDLLAPGESYPTTSTLTDTSYVDVLLWPYGGTSGATPHVAGAIGLLRSYFQNNLRPEDFECILKLASRDTAHMGSDGESLTWHERYGHGCLEVGNALMAAAGCSSFVYFSTTDGTGYAYTDTLEDFVFMTGPYMTGYKVIPYKVEATIDFEHTFTEPPKVWGVLTNPFPYTTSGYSGANPNYRIPFTGVYDSTVTVDRCVGWTFVYKIHDGSGTFLAWYPEAPADVPIGCKALLPRGRLAAAKRSAVGSALGAGNPFRAEMSMTLDVPMRSDVRVAVYDVRGRLVRRLCEAGGVEGSLEVHWDGSTESGRPAESGVYFVKYNVGGRTGCRKVLRIK